MRSDHAHTLALDGVYVRDEGGALHFQRLPDPTHEEVVEVATWVHERLARVLARHGRSLEGDDDAPGVLAEEQPALASLYEASAADRQLLGEAPGQTTRKLVRAVREVVPPGEALADVGGVNVHAGAAIDGRDRKRLERLCRYIARPPLAQERLDEHGDGRLRYRFKRAWRNGTYAVVLEPLDLVARLVALVPPPRFHMLRYHGVLAAHAKARAEVVPGRAASASSEPVQLWARLGGCECERGRERAGVDERACVPTPMGVAARAGVRGRRDGVPAVCGPHAPGEARHHARGNRQGAGPRRPRPAATSATMADDARPARASLRRCVKPK